MNREARVPLLWMPETTAMAGVDFRAVRWRIGIAEVLDLLTFVPSHRRTAQVRGPCPVHGRHSPQSRSFSAHLEKNVYRCFHCRSAGNQLDLWAAATRQPIWEAAIDLCDKLHQPVPWLNRSQNREKSPPAS